MKYRYLGVSALVLSAALTMPVASAQEVSYSASVDAVGEYVFRGFGLGAESIQVGVEAAIGDFTVGAWASTGFGNESIINADEIDLYASYGFALSESVSASVGATLYHYPQAGDLFDIGTDPGDASTFEIFGGLEFDAPLAPAVALYYDTTLETFTLEGGISGSNPTGEKSSFDWGLTAGHVDPDGGQEYQYLTASASLGYAFTDNVSGYVGVNGSLASEDNFLDYEDAVNSATFNFDSNTLWWGAGLSFGF